MGSRAVHALRRRLPACSLAAVSRCFSGQAKPTIGDARTPPLLTNKVHGVFINYVDHCRPHLFARPSSKSPQIDAMLDFLPGDDDRHRWWSVLDHSNGLLLCDMNQWGSKLCICNPATRRWTFIPWPAVDDPNSVGVYLAFDPAVSPHYEVLVIPYVPEKPPSPDHMEEEKELQPSFVYEEHKPHHDVHRLMEWPPTPFRLNIFSSRTGQWEERVFVREGEPAGTVEEMLLDRWEPNRREPRQLYAVYWQGAHYVHCKGHFVMRLSLSNNSYQVIKTPPYTEEKRYVKPYLGKSDKGVHFGLVHESELRVWILSESSRRMEWIIQCQDDLAYYAQHIGNHTNAPWMVHDVHDAEDDRKTLPEDRIEWDSDNDDFLTIKDEEADEHYHKYFEILGFHPYKEVVFLTDIFGVVAYHFKSSRVQYLGNSRPNSYYLNYSNGIYESFVYTPCMIGALEEGSTDRNSIEYQQCISTVLAAE